MRKYFALGDHACAMIALGETKASGSLYQMLGHRTAQNISEIKELLDANTPFYLAWAKAIAKLFLPV